MDIIRKTVNGNEYTFYNSFRGNRSGFVHETELVKNGRIIARNKVQYYNRTWERYTYETVMKGAVNILMDEEEKAYETAWKENHGIKRLTKEKRNTMEMDFWKNMPETYKEIVELGSML